MKIKIASVEQVRCPYSGLYQQLLQEESKTNPLVFQFTDKPTFSTTTEQLVSLFAI